LGAGSVGFPSRICEHKTDPVSPALIANLLKGNCSRYLREQFPKLKKMGGKEHLWTSSYYVGIAGNVSAEVIKRYIQECQGK
jgi:putative transposase